MAILDPKTLKSLREQKRWTLDKLASQAGLDRGTIHRAEQGDDPKRIRDHTFERLASALNAKPEVLSGQAPLEAGMATTPAWENTSDLTLRVDNASRNALQLVARRYRVPQARIVEIAPFLFYWAAEASLQRRASRLTEMEALYADQQARADQFAHLSFFLHSNWKAEEIAASERTSIEQRDLFAETVPLDDSGFNDAAVDEAEANPLTHFLRDLGAEVAEANFSSVGKHSRPHYEICRNDVAALVGNDANAVTAIMAGTAKLYEMPPEQRKGEPAGRALWAHEASAAFWAQVGQELEGFDFDPKPRETQESDR